MTRRSANEDLHRMLLQGSAQLQGEVLEFEVEEVLRTAFPLDDIEPVAKGKRGADGMRAQRLEVAILSRNDTVIGLRVFNSVKYRGLPIERGIFTCRRPPHRYLKPMQANLFLAANGADVRAALDPRLSGGAGL